MDDSRMGIENRLDYYRGQLSHAAEVIHLAAAWHDAVRKRIQELEAERRALRQPCIHTSAGVCVVCAAGTL